MAVEPRSLRRCYVCAESGSGKGWLRPDGQKITLPAVCAGLSTYTLPMPEHLMSAGLELLS